MITIVLNRSIIRGHLRFIFILLWLIKRQNKYDEQGY